MNLKLFTQIHVNKLNNYPIVRLDRNRFGGGVAIYIKKYYTILCENGFCNIVNIVK